MTGADATGTGAGAGGLSTEDRFRIAVFAAGVAVGGYLLGNLFALALVVLVQAGGVEVMGVPVRRYLITTIGLQGLGFGGTAYYVLTRYDLGWDYVKWSGPGLRELAFVVGGYVGLLALNVGLERLFSVLGIGIGSSTIVDTAIRNPALGMALIVLSLVLVGPAEELLYRGVVQTTFKRVLGAPGAIAATSAVFAAIHFVGVTGTTGERVAAVALIFLLATFLGSLYEYTGNLLVPAVVHGLYNATTFAIALFGPTGP